MHISFCVLHLLAQCSRRFLKSCAMSFCTSRKGQLKMAFPNEGAVYTATSVPLLCTSQLIWLDLGAVCHGLADCTSVHLSQHLFTWQLWE